MKQFLRNVVFGVAGVLCVFGLGVRAAEKPPEDYVKAMKDLATFLQTMTKPDAEKDFATATSFVPIVRDAFGTVVNFWTDRNSARKYFPEIFSAQDGIKEASDMGVAARLLSSEGVAASVKAIAGRCQPCHEARREKAADGTFLIKLE